MTRINLLPWREERRIQRQRDFLTLLGLAAAFAAAAMVLFQIHLDNRVQYQNGRNRYLEGEIARLKKAAEEIKEMRTTEDRLRERLQIIQNLQASRPTVVRIFDALVQLTPQDIYLDSLKSQGNRIILQGVALADSTISKFMRDLAESSLFDDPTLEVIETEEINNLPVRVFRLVVPRARNTTDEISGELS